MVHGRSRNLGETEKCLEERVELDPERVDAWFRLGDLRLLRDDPEVSL